MRKEWAACARREAAVLRIETILTTALAHLAMTADIAAAKFLAIGSDPAPRLADQPGRPYLCGILGKPLAAYAGGLAAVAVLAWPRRVNVSPATA